MGKPRYTAEQIITKLREAEVLQGKGMPVEEVIRQLGISDATYYKWRKEYGGLRVDQAKRLKQLEQENNQLRKVVSGLSIDIAILKEAARGDRIDPDRTRSFRATCMPCVGTTTLNAATNGRGQE